MDREYLTHGIEVGLDFIKTYHPTAHMYTKEGRERLTALLVNHLVTNWEMVVSRKQAVAVTVAASELTDSLEPRIPSPEQRIQHKIFDHEGEAPCSECLD